MKLTYWYSECQNDSDVYSIRERTKKAAVQALAELALPAGSTNQGPIVKVIVEYDDAFDLMVQMRHGEQAGYDEHMATSAAEAAAPGPQSGYTDCTCGTCFDTTVSSDMAKPELCSLCSDAGCAPGWACEVPPSVD